MRYSFSADAIRVGGVNPVDVVRGNVLASSVHVETPRVAIRLDRTQPGPKEQKPSTLPHQLLTRANRAIRIDAIRISDGDLAFSERAADGARYGTFRFTELNAMLSRVTNDTTQLDTPCTIEVQTRLAGDGQLDAVFEYDFRSRALDMTYHGTVGRMGGLSLNELLVDLEGIRVTGGVIDSTSFAIDVKDDVATGSLRVIYHDITFEMIDKNTLEKGLAERFGTLVYRTKARESNPDGDDPPIEIALRRTREPHVPLIKFVWETIREGLLRTLGVQ
jgi:hypothetical protein